jgi:hypothetical protein
MVQLFDFFFIANFHHFVKYILENEYYVADSMFLKKNLQKWEFYFPKFASNMKWYLRFSIFII